MGKHEIRLRRQMISSGRIARHRNYAQLMERHQRESRLRRVIRVFTYFLIIVFLFIILLMVIRWEEHQKRKEGDTKDTTTKILYPAGPNPSSSTRQSWLGAHPS